MDSLLFELLSKARLADLYEEKMNEMFNDESNFEDNTLRFCFCRMKKKKFKIILNFLKKYDHEENAAKKFS